MDGELERVDPADLQTLLWLDDRAVELYQKIVRSSSLSKERREEVSQDLAPTPTARF